MDLEKFIIEVIKEGYEKISPEGKAEINKILASKTRTERIDLRKFKKSR